MLQRERSGPMEMTTSAVEMVVLAMVMECSSMTVTMTTISPLREGISPAATQPAGELFSLCLLRLVVAAERNSGHHRGIWLSGG